MITAALPIYNSSEIVFLQLDALCNQKDAPDWELIVCEDPSDNFFGKEALATYKSKLKKAGCKRVVYLKLDQWVPLGQKWVMIRDFMHPKSIGMMLCAADNYSPKDRIAKTFESLSKGNEWFQYGEGDFYDIKSHKAGTMKCPDNGPGLFMAVAKIALDRINTTVYPKSGVDTWMLQNTQPVKRDVKGKTTGVHTDGYNNISMHRSLLYARKEAQHMFTEADADKTLLRIPKPTRTKLDKLTAKK